MKIFRTCSLLAAASVLSVDSFSVARQVSSTRASLSALGAEGFGPPKQEKKKPKSEGQVKREQERSKYDEIAATGGQEYSK